jgi:hypothetical protein
MNLKKQKHDMCKTKFQQDFITKNKNKNDKKTYPRLVLNRLKAMKFFIFIYIH